MPLPSPPTRPALRARYEARRSDVVACAAELFAERGYDGTSISELTAATGLAAGGLYHYIEGKDDLLIAICDELLEPLLAQAREIVATGAPPVAQLRELVAAWVAHVSPTATTCSSSPRSARRSSASPAGATSAPSAGPSRRSS